MKKFTQWCIFISLINLFSQRLIAITLDVKEFGAKGDAVICNASTSSGSPVVMLQGKGGLRPVPGMLVLIDRAGGGTHSTSQDYVGNVVKVIGNDSIEVNPLPETSVSLSRAIIGSDDALPFQRCVDSANGTNTVIKIPKGCYLLLPRQLLDRSYIMENPEQTCAAIVIKKGGMKFIGQNKNSSILLACGAWQLRGKFATRGQLFECRGPIIDTNILSFENITMDGGVEVGHLSNQNFPANTENGLGWDLTHSALMDSSGPYHSYKVFKNCNFIHWRGEMLKSVSDWPGGYTDVFDCIFMDGNASGFNLSCSHKIQRCKFQNLEMALEFYQGYSQSPSFFVYNNVSDVRGDLVLVGAQNTHQSPLYNIINNRLSSLSGFGVLLGPAENVTISSNRFFNHAFAVGTGPGYQGTTYNNNIRISQNYLSNVQSLLLVQGVDSDRIENVLVKNNTMTNGGTLGYGWGYSSNVVFSWNVCSSDVCFDGSRMKGEWFKDDLSNRYNGYLVFNYNDSKNIISYSHGARQLLLPTSSDSFFCLDDSHPEKTPPDAMLSLKCQGNLPAKIILSESSLNADSLLLKPGKSVLLAWTGSRWRLYGR